MVAVLPTCPGPSSMFDCYRSAPGLDAREGAVNGPVAVRHSR
jgi:hypothetical protein